MTMPWKTWIRDRVPSVTRTWTFNVSPGRKSGMSERIWACSSSAIAVCMAAVPQLSSRAHRPANAWHRLVGVCLSSWALRAPGRAPAGSAWCGWQTSVCHIFSTDREASVNEHLPVACVEPLTGWSCGQPGGQVGAQRSGSPQRLVAPPAGDGRVVPGQQDWRDLTPAPDPGPGVGGPLEQAVHGARTCAERIV